MLQNAYLDAKIGVDTEENGPSKVWGPKCGFGSKLVHVVKIGLVSLRNRRTFQLADYHDSQLNEILLVVQKEKTASGF